MKEIIKKIVEIELLEKNYNIETLIIYNIYKIPGEIFTEYLIFCFCKNFEENPTYFTIISKIANKEFSENIEKINLDKIMNTILTQSDDWNVILKKFKRYLTFYKDYSVILEDIKL